MVSLGSLCLVLALFCVQHFANALRLPLGCGRGFTGGFGSNRGGMGGGGGGRIGGRGGGGGGGLYGSAGGLSAGGSGKAKQGLLLWLTKLLEQYSGLLEKHPYMTKAISSGIVGGSGDVLIQQFQRRRDSNKQFDWRRLLVFSTVAAFYIAPIIHVWFGYLNNLPYPATMSAFTKAGIMTVLDQTFGALIVTVGFFYFFEMVQHLVPPYPADRKKSFIQAGYESNVNNLWETLVANWYCWPLINFVNFLVIPIHFRVLFSNFAAVFWNMFLSSVANRKAPAPPKK